MRGAKLRDLGARVRACASCIMLQDVQPAFARLRQRDLP